MLKIEYLEPTEDVYDITVERTHCFFANDILVHNCVEIKLPTKPYNHITELYKNQYDEGDGEVAVCAIAGTSVGKFEIGKEDEQHKEAAWVALDMIHTAITETEYPFPQVKFTANQRRSAGVGIIDLAHDLARRGLKYSTLEGRNYIHKVAERHYWYLTEAALELSKEFGNAAWMDKTLWPKGWLPLDTYKKSIDDIVTEPLHYDWESRRQEIIDNGGHAFSVLVANMPAESSSIKSGTSNGPYPVRDKDLKKSNDQLTYSYVVPESDEYGDDYELAWDIDVEDIAKVYGVLQKWADQMTSADLWYKSQGEKINSHDLMRGQFALIKYGVPGRYYLNSLTGKNKSMTENKSIVQADAEYQPDSTAECAGCKL